MKEEQTMSSRIVTHGPYKGHPIRTARKAFVCNTFLGLQDGIRTFCKTNVAIGGQYVEGDSAPYIAGGFGHEKLCFRCAHITTEDNDQ